HRPFVFGELTKAAHPRSGPLAPATAVALPNEEGAVNLLDWRSVGRIASPAHRCPSSQVELHPPEVMAAVSPVGRLVPVDAESLGLEPSRHPEAGLAADDRPKLADLGRLDAAQLLLLAGVVLHPDVLALPIGRAESCGCEEEECE